MKKFRFTLQALLTVRQQAEQKALESYSRALAARQEAHQRLLAANRELAQASDDLARELAEGAPAARASLSRAWCQVLETRQQHAARSLQEAEAALQQAHRSMLATRQDREAVENFQDQQHQRYDRQLLREEQKVLDDLVSSRFVPAVAWPEPAHHLWN